GVLAVLQLCSGLAMLPVRPREGAVPARPAGAPRAGIVASIRSGFRYALATQPLRSLVMMNFVIGLISASLAILLPDVARNALGRDAFAASLLVAAIIPGMILTTLWLASRPSLSHRGALTLIGLFAVVPMLVVSGLSDSYWLTLGNVLFWGTPMGLMVTLLRGLTQEVTSDEMMGRVMSVVHVFSRGTLPLASLGLLFLVKVVPAREALVFVGIGVAAVALAIALNPAVRRL
ncbi:MAG: MFS transporter, partial [Acidimicrobiia bacterium]|nr:MFS transporter [Acidimicrobiia bacterium]